MAETSTTELGFSEIDSIGNCRNFIFQLLPALGDTSSIFQVITGKNQQPVHQHHPNCKHAPDRLQTVEETETEPSFVERFHYFLVALPFIALFSFKEALEHTDGRSLSADACLY